MRQPFDMVIATLGFDGEALSLIRDLRGLFPELPLVLLHDQTATLRQVQLAARLGAHVIDSDTSRQTIRMRIAHLLKLHLPAASPLNKEPSKWATSTSRVEAIRDQVKALGQNPGVEFALLADLNGQTIAAENVPARQLTIHADRGSSMASKPVALLLADLGVTKTHSRPRVSNDNPYSESQFKTLKYSPSFPGKFASIEDAREFCAEFFHAYNHHHRHAGLGLLTPEVVHTGQAETVRHQRPVVLTAAHALHGNRFRRPPQPPELPGSSWINRPMESELAAQ